MTEIEEAEEAYRHAKRALLDLRKQYLLAESELIHRKIVLERLQDRDKYERSNVVDTDDLRDLEIAEFRLKYPELCGSHEE